MSTYKDLMTNNRASLAEYATMLIDLIYNADAWGDDETATAYRESFRVVMDSIHRIDHEIGGADE